MKNKLFKIGLTALASISLVACGNDDQGTEKAEGSYSVGMVTDLNSVNDKSFNQSTWEGLQKLEEDFGYDVSYLEPQSDGDVETSLLQFVNSGTDLTWASSSTLEESVKKIAESNPDAHLGLVDSTLEGFEGLDNVVSVLFKENEGAYLAGIVAGAMTETNKVGFLGGMEIPVVERFHAGFEAGVKEVNPDAEVLSNYVGIFTRADMGKSAASTLYNNGVDIILHAAGGTGNGAFNEAQERFDNGEQVWVIGADKDQSLEFGNDITLTSVMKYVDQAVYDVSHQAATGEFPGGKVVPLGIKENGIGLADTSDTNIPQDILDLVEEYKEKIANNEIEVPDTL